MRFREFSSSNNEGLNESRDVRKELEDKKRRLKHLEEMNEMFGIDSFEETMKLKVEISGLEFELEHGRKKTIEDIEAELRAAGLDKKWDDAYDEMQEHQAEKEARRHYKPGGKGIDTDWIIENETKEYDEFNTSNSSFKVEDGDDEMFRMINENYDPVEIEIAATKHRIAECNRMIEDLKKSIAEDELLNMFDENPLPITNQSEPKMSGDEFQQMLDELEKNTKETEEMLEEIKKQIGGTF